MTLVGVDLHTRDQSIAVLDTETGEVRERRLQHGGDEVEQFYGSLGRPVTVGIESTGYEFRETLTPAHRVA
jgi:transposase